jgi:plasmid stabilization system protein ParE
MSRKLIVEPQAEGEIAAAAAWYEGLERGLGADFVDEVEHALTRIERNPYQYQIVYRQARRAMLRRFRYGIIYRVSDHEVIVIACFHVHRDPKR